MADGISANKILTLGLTKGMENVGRRFQDREYFLADLMTATYIMEQAVKVIEAKLEVEVGEAQLRGKVVFGTVQGDLHTIGKDITISLLRVSGYEVVDLGVDVSPEIFVQKVMEVRPDFVAMSALLLTTLPSMEDIVRALKKAGLRNEVFIMIGGATTTLDFANRIGVDAYCATAIEGVDVANRHMEKKKEG